MIDRHVIQIVLDPAGRPVGGSATTYLDDDTYRTAPVEPGPFDTIGEFLTELQSRLDLQGTLW